MMEGWYNTEISVYFDVLTCGYLGFDVLVGSVLFELL